MSNLEYQKIYERPEFTDQERRYYFDLSPAEETMVARQNQVRSKIHLILQLGYFKSKRRFFRYQLDDVKDDICYVCRRYFPGELDRDMTLPSDNTCRQNNQRIINHFDFELPKGDQAQKIKDRIQFLVGQFSDPIAVTRNLLNGLAARNIVFPEYRWLQDIIGLAISQEEKRLAAIINDQLNEQGIALINDALNPRDHHATLIKHLNIFPKNFKYGQMNEEIKKLNDNTVLYDLANKIVPKLKLSARNTQYYSTLATYYRSGQLKQMKFEKMAVCILCYCYYRFRVFHDHALQAFQFNHSRYTKSATTVANDLANKLSSTVAGDYKQASQYLQYFGKEEWYDEKFGTVCERVHKKTSQERLDKVAKHMRSQLIDKEELKYQYYAKIAKTIQRNMRPLFKALELTYHDAAKPIQDAAEKFKALIDQKKTLELVNDLPTAFIPKKLKKYIINGKDIDLDKYEFLLYVRCQLTLPLATTNFAEIN